MTTDDEKQKPPDSWEDLAALEHIRKRLWQGHEYGQASVMIGAGFSRLAVPVRTGIARMPLWSDLAERIWTELNPGSQLCEEKKGMIQSQALRLASQYEALHGRSSLDTLLIKLIPDNDFRPSARHTNLLRLPWSDLFTTNYDTLLERARDHVYARHYCSVQTAQDIPLARRPRIVKLHGSFPSHRPFIITDEDYRTYPDKSAPFVNLVQQSLMENALCLLGFSGDDPNFLNWTGWVRDNLGNSAPKIYLCGVLDLSNSERMLIQNRNIAPIDLGLLFPKQKCGEPDERHSEAMDWFLWFLENGKPLGKEDWPYSDVSHSPKPKSDWPEFSHINNRVPCEIYLGPPKSPARTYDKEELETCLDFWQSSRTAYPGWLVCPREKRKSVWSQHSFYGISQYTDVIIDSLEVLSPEKQLFVLHEISWRYDICLSPLSISLKQAVDRILASFCPFPNIQGFEGAAFSISDIKYSNFDWTKIRESWVFLAFSRIKAAREDFAEETFNRWCKILESIVKDNQEWACRLTYEICLASLDVLNQDLLAKQLKDWSKSENPPVWLIRQAALLAELGELDEAELIASAALSQIRSQQRSREDDIRLMSEEAWAMILLEMIVAGKCAKDDDAWERRMALQREYRGRLRYLALYFCDPWPDIESLRNAVNSPALQVDSEIKQGFDPWCYYETHHYGTSGIDSSVLSAHSLIRLHEDGGFPMRTGMVTADIETIKNTVRCIFTERPAFAISLALRSGDTKSLEFIDRVSIAILPTSEVERIFEFVYNSVSQTVLPPQKKRTAHQSPSRLLPELLLTGCIEVLSRTAFRLSKEKRHKLFDLAVSLYEDSRVQNNHLLYNKLENLFTRLLYALQEDEIDSYLLTLIQLTIPDIRGSRIKMPSLWPEPCKHLDIVHCLSCHRDLVPKGALKRLLDVLAEESIEARSRALLRLVKLRERVLLSEDQSKECVRALWSQVDDQTLLPQLEPRLGLSLILAFPETEKHEYRFLKEYFLKTAIPGTDLNRSSERLVNSYPTPLIQAATKYIFSLYACSKPLWVKHESNYVLGYIDWTQDEAKQLTERAVTFWENEKYDLAATKKMSKFLVDAQKETKQLFAKFAHILFLHLVPRLLNHSHVLCQQLTQIHGEMLTEGVPVLCTLPALLIMKTTTESDVVTRIKSGLQSLDESLVLQAADAIYFWACFAENSEIGLPAVSDDLMKEIIGFALARRQPGLEFVLSRLAGIVRNSPKSLTDQDKESLCAALSDILRETVLPTSLIEYFQEKALLNRSIAASKKIEYQAVGADLASALYADYSRRSCAMPSSLEDWKELSETTPLPEVRRAWQSQAK
ncbi:MAG TPA: SIR2 family protein [Candidatus Hydrogenedentes bacterium]|nr:SIR2 family protein [Candidatus Hydrogenedentota bacterium]